MRWIGLPLIQLMIQVAVGFCAIEYVVVLYHFKKREPLCVILESATRFIERSEINLRTTDRFSTNCGTQSGRFGYSP